MTGHHHLNRTGFTQARVIVASLHKQRGRRRDRVTVHDTVPSVAERIDEWVRWSA